MPKHGEKISAADRLHFRKLLDEKPFLWVGDELLPWDVLCQSARILSESADAVNHEKLSMQWGLSTKHVAGANGRRLVAARIRAQNIGTFLAKFDYLEPPSWFVSNFDVDKAVDDLFGLATRWGPLSGAFVIPFSEWRECLYHYLLI